MNNQSTFINWILVLLISSVQFIPSFGAIDQVAPQFFFISLITLFSFVYLVRQVFNRKEIVIYKNKLLTHFLLFSCLCLLSLLWSFNSVEGLINYFEILLMFFCLYNLSHHFLIIKPDFKHVSFLFIFILTSDVLFILISFLDIYDFSNPPPRSNDLVGFSGNLNISGFSLLFRLPFVTFFIFTEHNKFRKALYFILFGLTLFFIITSGSRGAILAFFLLFPIFIVSQLLLKSAQRNLIFYLLGFTVSVFTIHSFLYQNGTTFVSRVQTLAPTSLNNDNSSNERLAWYKAAFEGIIEKPFTGHGIGNWKIVGNKYVTDYIEQYIVPKYVHNDFLEVFAEVGILGGLLFVGFFVMLFITLYKRKDRLKNWKLEGSLIIFSIMAYIIDSNLNFPFQRPISVINLLLVCAFIISIDEHKKFKIKYAKTISAFIFTGLIIILYSTGKVFKGYIDEVEFVDRLNHSRGFNDTTLSKIEKLNDRYPNITYTTIPIVTYKALYNWKNGNLEKAKRLLRKGNTINPFLYVAESNLASIMLEEGKIDSAYHFAKKAFYGLPNNVRHTNIYQAAIGAKNDLNELDRVFDLVRHREKELIYSNHLALIASLKVKDTFSPRDREVAAEAIKLFPNNRKFMLYNRVISDGIKSVDQANKYDKEALKFFDENRYEKALEKWELAKKALPTESSYYLNIAQTYSILGDYESSNLQLDSLSNLSIDNHKGKQEFIRAMNQILLNDINGACKDLIIAYRKGYKKESIPLIKRLKCMVNKTDQF